jgi:phosphoribosyl 1,2-cyclic phosphodiesterase
VTVEVVVLASGSSGNAALIASGDTALLIDAGISATAIVTRLERFGHRLPEVASVLLTHEHSDHASGLEVLTRRHHLPVWATRGTWSALPLSSDGGGELASGREARIGRLRVLPVATSHDAREPVALVVDDGAHRLALCTDTGVVTTLLEQRIAGCELLLLECNHDADLLRHGPYPWPLKQRIASRHGHLANHQSEESAARLRSLWLKGVIGLHLSEHNNRPELAREALLGGVGPGPVVEVVTRWEMLRVVLGSAGVEVERQPVPRRRARPDGG